MKPALILIVLAFLSSILSAQIIRPQIKSGFGIEAEIESALFVDENSGDDWFSKNSIGMGSQVIDTNGAASLLQRYLTHPLSLNQSFSKTMSQPVFSLIDNNRWLDALFVRDFHRDDSTVFSGGNKNGQSPANWVTPVSQSIPDKTEILDVFMHVRRSGPSDTDSLWMFGGVSIENNTGNRYFDFEMYQTNIVYDRASLRFTGYGPDAGHTSWKFDAAGNVIQPGDIILTAEYSSSSLTLIQARIWIKKSDLSITPTNFSWSGQFDGAASGSMYGYASILPKTSGAFYSGLQNEDNVWGGPFKIVLGNNSVVDNYIPRQFMEFSVNLTKLGLDPITLLGGSSCRQPFKKVMVKTRSSTSFTSELKDFVAPMAFLNPPAVDLFTDVPVFCGEFSISNIKVTNPIATSIYTWSTTDGHFADTSNPLSVFVDQPGTYIVYQQLQQDCPYVSSDTIVITFDATCGILANEQLNFKGSMQNQQATLTWNHLSVMKVAQYQLQKSIDGIHFVAVKNFLPPSSGNSLLSAIDLLENEASPYLYYRLRILYQNKSFRHSNIVQFTTPVQALSKLTIMPNPVKNEINILGNQQKAGQIQMDIFDPVGKILFTKTYNWNGGFNKQTISGFQSWPRGIYTIRIASGKDFITRRLLFSSD